MKRSILLQTEATAAKDRRLEEFLDKAVKASNLLLVERGKHKKSKDLQRAVAPAFKKDYGFNIQVVCSLARDAWAKPKECKSVKGVTVKFNVPRNCKTFDTKGFHFVELGTYPGNRIAVPIRKNRNWDRFAGLLGNGWKCKTYGLTPSLEVVAYLSKGEKEKEKDIPQGRKKNVIGIDINAKDFAYTVMAPGGKVLKQGYLGQRMWIKKQHFAERRALLQSLNARKKLKRMRRKQKNYVKTNIGQLVREIVLLAKRFDADVSIENLRTFRPKGRTFNKKVLTIPFSLFRKTLEARCFDRGIKLYRVDPYHTSKWCVRCGALNAGHVPENYALYRCASCGLAMNSDRKASVAVAAKTLLERRGSSSSDQGASLQISGRRVPVSGLVRRTSPMTPSGAVSDPAAQARGKPTGFSRG